MNIVEMVITPAQASVWLAANNTRNRNISRIVVNAYAEDMKNGRWVETHQNAIAFYHDGNIADGQHRLMAIAQSGVSVKMMVCYGLTDSAVFGIDNHRKRDVSDQIALEGSESWITRDAVSIVRLSIMAGKDREKVRSVGIVVDVAKRNRDRIEFSLNNMVGKKQGIHKAAVLFAIASAYGYENSDKLSSFCAMLSDGIISSSEAAIIVMLRDKLMSDRFFVSSYKSRIECALMTQRAIKAYCNGESVKRLVVPNEWIYPNFAYEEKDSGSER